MEKPIVLSRTLYVREEDGTLHIEKQEVATPGHPIVLENRYSANHLWSVVDRGIPVDVLLEEDEEEEMHVAKETKKEAKVDVKEGIFKQPKSENTILIQKEEIKSPKVTKAAAALQKETVKKDPKDGDKLTPFPKEEIKKSEKKSGAKEEIKKSQKKSGAKAAVPASLLQEGAKAKAKKTKLRTAAKTHHQSRDVEKATAKARARKKLLKRRR